MTVLRATLVLIALGASIARGDVVTSLSGPELLVTGDSAPNAIAITPAVGGIAVTGFDGTLVDGGSASVTFTGVQRLSVKLMQADDRVLVSQVTLAGSLYVGVGKGNDSVELDQVFAGAVRIQTSKGYDAVRIFGPSRFDSLTVQLGTGADLLVVQAVDVGGDLTAIAGGDDDDVSIAGVTVYHDLDVHLGNGDDFLSVGDVAIGDDTHLAGDDDDVLVLYGYLWFEDELDIDGFGIDDWWWW